MRISDWSSDLCSSDLTQILPFSTGVILEPLPVDRLVAALPSAIDSLDSANWFAAAPRIMTHDTQPNIVSPRVACGAPTVTIPGLPQGAGRPRPNMAPLLGLLAAAAGLPPAHVHKATRPITNRL